MSARTRSGLRFAHVTLIAVTSIIAGCGSSGGAKSTSTATNVKVQISAPADGSTIRADRVAIRGTVNPPDATVQILGTPGQVGNGVFTGSVALHRGANTIDVVASAPGATPATTTITVTRPGPRKASGDKSPSGGTTSSGGTAPTTRAAPALSGPTDCGGGLTAGAHTSCPFAENVRAAYRQTGGGAIDVYSPTTGRTYRMYCTSSAPHVCTGGNNASVYFSDSGTGTSYDTSGCGGGLDVGPTTSCAFAVNVRAAYERTGSNSLSVYSPTTGRTYSMFCTSSSPHVCTGGNNAAVYFP